MTAVPATGSSLAPTLHDRRDGQAAADPVEQRRASPSIDVALALAVFMGAFLFRFLTPDFTNDHFQHLARGRQILLGELPIRDFFDPGLIFQYYASSIALLVSGQNLLGEAVLTIGFLAAGAALTYAVAAQLSGSRWIGLAAALIAVMSSPRLYNYPKVFFYVLGLAMAWRYARNRTFGNIGWFAGATVLAFLFRHDHGVYTGLAALVFFPVLYGRDWRRTAVVVGQYSVTCLALLLPFLIYVQSSVGLVRYVTGISPQISHVATVRLNSLPFTVDRSAPLFTLTPPDDLRVNIRWAPELTDADRRTLETRYSLVSPDLVEGSTWSYAPQDDSHANIRALVDHPQVADTHGIDRATGRVDVFEPLYLRIYRWVPIFRLQIAPGIFNRGNALVWYYYLTLTLPFIAALLLTLLLWRDAITKGEAAVAAMAIALTIIIDQTLVRGSPDSRLADVAGPTCVLGAWVVARCLAAARTLPTSFRRASVTAVIVVVLVSAWSVGTDGYAGTRLVASRIVTGPAGVWWAMGVQIDRLRTRPIDTIKKEEAGVPALTRYVFDCTSPDDRVLVTWFAPEIFFYSERAFAGGQVYLQPRWHASAADQQLTVERMSRERVPLVLVRSSSDNRTYFPTVNEYILANYREARIQSPSLEGYRVFTDSRLTPLREHPEFGLPCFR